MANKTKTKISVVRVSLGSDSYEVLIGKAAVLQLAQKIKSSTKKAFLISDEALIEQRKKVITVLRKSGWEVHEFAVKAGEDFKDFSNIYPVYGEMLNSGIDRNSTLIALGGGSIGDAAGFIASTFMRGIPWVGIPTTLLAQVDSSVGGKTAVNHSQGKNLIGTFYQPSLVICDTDFLSTLSSRELVSGLGEISKYALTFDKGLFEYLSTHLTKVLKFNTKDLTEVIKTSLKWKAKSVSKDVFDRSGVREVLNFGHTFGHALETLTHYQVFQHGEAVIWGMRFACHLSHIRGHLKEEKLKEIENFLSKVPVPSIPENIPFEDFLKVMKKDKKSEKGQVRFVLLKGLAKTISDKEVTTVDLEGAFRALGNRRLNQG